MESPALPGIPALPVVITGSWIDGPRLDWRGTAISSAPLVALVMLRVPGLVEWCKSERATEDDLPLRLVLFSSKDNTEVQVNFSAREGGRRWTTSLPARDSRPNILERMEAVTGRLLRLALVEGDPPVELALLLLDAGSVEVGRNGIWHLRRDRAEGVPEPLRRALTGGRTGRWREDG